MLLSKSAYSRPTPVPKMPPGIIELMEGLGKDVLKHNPPDVYEFCANHMKKLLEIRDGPSNIKAIPLDKRIKKAQEIIRKRSKQYWRNKKCAGAEEEKITQKVLNPVHHDSDLANASEIEISFQPGDSPVLPMPPIILEHSKENTHKKEVNIRASQQSEEKTQEILSDPIAVVEAKETKHVENGDNDSMEGTEKSVLSNDIIIPDKDVAVKEVIEPEPKNIDDVLMKDDGNSELSNDDIPVEKVAVKKVTEPDEDIMLKIDHSINSENHEQKVGTVTEHNIINDFEQNITRETIHEPGEIVNAKEDVIRGEQKESDNHSQNINSDETNSVQTDLIFKDAKKNLVVHIDDAENSSGVKIFVTESEKRTTEINDDVDQDSTKTDHIKEGQVVAEKSLDVPNLTDETKVGADVLLKLNGNNVHNALVKFVGKDTETALESDQEHEKKLIVNVDDNKDKLNIKNTVINVQENTKGLNKDTQMIEYDSTNHKVQSNNENTTNDLKSTINEHKGDNLESSTNVKQSTQNNDAIRTNNKLVEKNTVEDTRKYLDDTINENKEDKLDSSTNIEQSAQNNDDNSINNMKVQNITVEDSATSVAAITQDITVKVDKPGQGNRNKGQNDSIVSSTDTSSTQLNKADKDLTNATSVKAITQDMKVEVDKLNQGNGKIGQNDSDVSSMDASSTELNKVDNVLTNFIVRDPVEKCETQISEDDANEHSESVSNLNSDLISRDNLQTQIIANKKEDLEEVTARPKRDIQNVDTDALETGQEMNSGNAKEMPPVVDYSATEESNSMNSVVEGDATGCTENIRNENSNTMDLETAAVTIQKVFRSFLFKSRASTFDESVNDDDNNLSDDDNDDENKESRFLPSTNKDRRTLGISRMDTVLQTVNEEKSLSLSTDDSSTLSSAATIIQAHVRGYLVRNKLHSGKTASSTNSVINSDGPSTTSLEGEGDQHKSKTILNIHIVPEGNNFLSRDESMITSMDLSLDGSPPSSVNLHPLGYDKSERRKQLKREDAIQSVSPPSNNSGKLSEDVESVKELQSNSGSLVNTSLEQETAAATVTNNDVNKKSKKDSESIDTPLTNSITVETVLDTVKSSTEISSSPEQVQDLSDKTLIKQSSDEMDVVTPYKGNTPRDSETSSRLMHTGEFHDIVLPTKVSRSNTPVVSEFKNVLVFFLLWNNS